MPTATGIATLPSCGQLCFNNMLALYSSLGCATPDPVCLCNNVNFSYGIRDCSNGAYGAVVASKVIAYGSSYCASATAS
jgi:CFEM domain